MNAHGKDAGGGLIKTGAAGDELIHTGRLVGDEVIHTGRLAGDELIHTGRLN